VSVPLAPVSLARSSWPLATALTTLMVTSAGCLLPCEASEECPADMYCNAESFCAKDCAQDGDCELFRSCVRGRCTLGIAPIPTWISPEEGATVDGPFDVEIMLEYRAPSVELTLERLPSAPGDACQPHVPRRIVVEGAANADLAQTVVFEDVLPLGEDFGFRLEAMANGFPVTLERTFQGPPSEGLGGAMIDAPRELIVSADDSMTIELEARIEPRADVVTAWVEPTGTRPPTPRRIVGRDTLTVEDTRLPLARGGQIVWLETERGDERLRCGVGVGTDRTENAKPIELGLTWDTLHDDRGRVELRVVAERSEEDLEICRADEEGVCLAGERHDGGLRTHGESALLLPQEEGIYGVAVVPAAATGPIRADVRVANGNVHLGWLGPRTVQPDLGEVWLAARVVVLGGVVTIEPIDRIEPGLPAIAASSW
jgi:hypothetical protein